MFGLKKKKEPSLKNQDVKECLGLFKISLEWHNVNLSVKFSMVPIISCSMWYVPPHPPSFLKVSQKSHREKDSEVTGDGLSNVVTLGRQFCQWFFQLLNSQNPTFGQQPQDWGPQHFWDDVRLRLLASTENESKEEFLGAELVSLRLQALSRDESLLFSPNLEPPGLRTISTAHGLVVVAVAGTIHRGQACLGIFEQVFGLIRSPLNDNSWKMKCIDLKIRAKNSVKDQDELVSPALTYSSSELQLLCSWRQHVDIA